MGRRGAWHARTLNLHRFRPRRFDKKRDIGLVLANVNEQPLSLMRRAGFAAELGEESIVPTVAAFDDRPAQRAA